MLPTSALGILRDTYEIQREDESDYLLFSEQKRYSLCEREATGVNFYEQNLRAKTRS